MDKETKPSGFLYTLGISLRIGDFTYLSRREVILLQSVYRNKNKTLMLSDYETNAEESVRTTKEGISGQTEISGFYLSRGARV
jgi:hypothetical protein